MLYVKLSKYKHAGTFIVNINYIGIFTLTPTQPVSLKAVFKEKKDDFLLSRVFVLVQGMSKEQMMEIRRQNCNPMIMKVTYYKKPVFIHQGYMQWLWDVDGRRYLDLFAGVATVSVGHCHP